MNSEFLTKAELKRILNGSYTAVWHNPVDDIIYGGETVKNGKAIPTYENAIFNLGEYKQAKALKDAGKLDKTELPYKGWIGGFSYILTVFVLDSTITLVA